MYYSADLYYSTYEVLEHKCMVNNWIVLNRLLLKVGKYTIEKAKELNMIIDDNMELTMNTKSDWCGKIIK